MSTRHEQSNLVQIVQAREIPSNKSLNTELEATKQFLDRQETHANTKKEQQILQDTRLLVEAAQETLQSKNNDEKVQRLIRDLKALKFSPRSTSDQKLSTEFIAFSNALRVFVTSLVKSSTFRTELILMLSLMKDVLSYQKPRGFTEQIKNDLVEQQKTVTQTVKESLMEIKDSLSESKWEDLPQDYKCELTERFRNLLKEISSQPTSAKAFKRLLILLPLIKSKIYTQYEATMANRELKKASEGTKSLVEQFTGGRSLDVFLAKLKTIVNIIHSDVEIKNYLYQMRLHLEKGLDSSQYVRSEEFEVCTNQLFQTGRYLAQKYHKREFKDLIDETELLLESIKNDEMVELLRNRVKRVVKNFTYTDAMGKNRLDMEAISTMKSLIIPFLIERVREIPIPRIDIHHKDFEYIIIDDLFLRISQIVPDSVKICVFNDLSLDIKSNSYSTPRSQLEIKIRGVEVVIKDFYFSFKRRKLLSITDEGRANLFITRGGLDIIAVFDIKTGNKTFMTPNRMHVLVHKLKIDIKDAKHKALLSIVTSVFSGALEKHIQRTTEQNLMEISQDFAEIINQQVLPKVRIPFYPMKEDAQEKVSTT